MRYNVLKKKAVNESRSTTVSTTTTKGFISSSASNVTTSNRCLLPEALDRRLLLHRRHSTQAPTTDALLTSYLIEAVPEFKKLHTLFPYETSPLSHRSGGSKLIGPFESNTTALPLLRESLHGSSTRYDECKLTKLSAETNRGVLSRPYRSLENLISIKKLDTLNYNPNPFSFSEGSRKTCHGLARNIASCFVTSEASTSELHSYTPTPSHHTYVCDSIPCGGVWTIQRVNMKGKGNRSNSTSTARNHQVSSGGTQSSNPRTPGTPTDPGAHSANSPTAGSSNSSSIVGSSPQSQFVAITVEQNSPSNENSLNGGNAYVTYVEGSAEHSNIYSTSVNTSPSNANGHNISYPMYATVGGETGAVYASTGSNSSTNWISAGSSSNGVSYAQEGGIYMVQSAASMGNNNNLTMDGGTTANITNRVSPATRRRKNIPELLPSPSTSQRVLRRSSARRNQNPPTDSNSNEENSNVENVSVTVNVNTNSGNESQQLVYSFQSGLETIGSSDMPELDHFGFDQGDGVMQMQGHIGGVAPPNIDMDSSIQMDDSHEDDFLSDISAANAIAKTSPVTLQWLMENYETAEGVSLPRSTLYNHYLRHCAQHKLDPVNAASFGKLIRSVFVGLRTRRLGTRGNSKYHYYGIRVKPDSPLNHVKDEGFLMNGNFSSNGHHLPSHRGSHHGSGAGGAKRFKPTSRNDLGDSNGFVLGDTSAFLEYLGNPSPTFETLPEINTPPDEEYPDGVTKTDLLTFSTLYKEHCKVQLATLQSFQLNQFEDNWRLFWSTDEDSLGNADLEQRMQFLPKEKLVQISMMTEVQDFVKCVDYQFYQQAVELLLPDVLRPIPSAMTQAIRNFAKVLETWLSTSMAGYPEDFVRLRLSVANALAQTLRRYTSLNHLAQAARAVLLNQNQITQMLADLNRVDFRNLEEQAAWVCGCADDTVSSLEQDFKTTLSQQQSLDEWAMWLEKVVDKITKPHENKPNFVTAARNFLLKWSFYSSLIIRDLTLRSAASFGSFHLLRLLYDEYIFYVVEHRVASATGLVPIQVIGKLN